MRKKIVFLFALIALCLPLLAQEESYILGQNLDWAASALIMDSLSSEQGYKNYNDLVIAHAEAVMDQDTDLLINFNQSLPQSIKGYYQIQGKNKLFIARKAALKGGGSGYFSDEKTAISLKALPGALFYPGAYWRDFSIEFWLYPAQLTNGETILLWKGAAATGESVYHQEFRCYINNRRLHWSFRNFFFNTQGSPQSEYELSAVSDIVPQKWRHHMLRFSSQNGLMEYLVDGKPEAITYISQSGKEDGSILLPLIGKVSRGNFFIGPDYAGLMDDLKISRNWQKDPDLSIYSRDGGLYLSKIIDLKQYNLQLHEIRAVFKEKDLSRLNFFVMSSNTKSNDFFLNPTNDPSLNYAALRFWREGGEKPQVVQDWLNQSKWTAFNPGESLPADLKGRFYQFKIEFLSNGRADQSPRLSELELIYEKHSPPLPPGRIAALGTGGGIKLSWSKVRLQSTAGYLVYYGTKPGFYHCDDARQGVSPIDVGDKTEIELSGLKADKVYYIAIVSYDNSSPPMKSRFSEEIAARPLALQD